MTLLLWLAIAAALLALFLLPGSTPAMDTRAHPDGLGVLEQVPVSETRQWVLIRTEDVANPVVLFVHGGPGTSWLTLMRRNTRPLERYFTVVNWDQRRAGKSFAAGRDRARMTMGQFVDDVVDLSSYLARRFRKERILLVGHSCLHEEMFRTDLFVQAPALQVPVWLCLGRHDREVPSELSARYFEALEAPRKQLVWFERSAHLPNTEESEKFNRLLVDAVLPALRG